MTYCVFIGLIYWIESFVNYGIFTHNTIPHCAATNNIRNKINCW